MMILRAIQRLWFGDIYIIREANNEQCTGYTITGIYLHDQCQIGITIIKKFSQMHQDDPHEIQFLPRIYMFFPITIL